MNAIDRVYGNRGLHVFAKHSVLGHRLQANAGQQKPALTPFPDQFTCVFDLQWPRLPMFSLILKSALISLIPNLSMACDTALILTIDVSNSVDAAEYRLQVDGLAAALRDPEIMEAMVSQSAAIAVVQWSGTQRQEVSVPWTRIRTSLDAALLADISHLMPRAFLLSDTAPAEAIRFSLPLFAQVPDCKNKVIDISGDGTPNSGTSTRKARNLAEAMGVTINGVAIESMGVAISNFYRGSVITRNGFVITARTHREYPDAIRRKILRELSMVLG